MLNDNWYLRTAHAILLAPAFMLVLVSCNTFVHQAQHSSRNINTAPMQHAGSVLGYATYLRLTCKTCASCIHHTEMYATAPLPPWCAPQWPSPRASQPSSSAPQSVEMARYQHGMDIGQMGTDLQITLLLLWSHKALAVLLFVVSRACGS